MTERQAPSFGPGGSDADPSAVEALRRVFSVKRQRASMRNRRIAGNTEVSRTRRDIRVILASYFQRPDAALRALEKRLNDGESAMDVCWALHVNPRAFPGGWHGEGVPSETPPRAYRPDQSEVLPNVNKLAEVLATARACAEGRKGKT